MPDVNEKELLNLFVRDASRKIGAVANSLGELYNDQHADYGVGAVVRRMRRAEAEIERLRGRDRWVPVSERLPAATDGHRSGFVLCYVPDYPGEKRRPGYYDYSRQKWYFSASSGTVTHWQPLPAGPTSATAEVENWPDCSGAVEADNA